MIEGAKFKWSHAPPELGIHNFWAYLSKWQWRAKAESAWSDIPGTEHTWDVCSYSPIEPGQYGAVAEISKNFPTVE